MSDWISFVEAYAKKHGIKYGEAFSLALKKAAPEYRKRKGKGTVGEEVIPPFLFFVTCPGYTWGFGKVVPEREIKILLKTGCKGCNWCYGCNRTGAHWVLPAGVWAVTDTSVGPS